MSHEAALHVLTVGWDRKLIEGLCDRVAARSGHTFSHVLHPAYEGEAWDGKLKGDVYFVFENRQRELPPADREFLASLERDGVPTVHNMILGDWIVSQLPYEDALAYASFLGKRLAALYERVRPDAILGAFDMLHGSMALAVARKMNIPWYALRFSVLPPGLACFCDTVSPASTVSLRPPSRDQLRAQAEKALADFEADKIKAHAPLTPSFLSPRYIAGRIPSQLRALAATFGRGMRGRFNRYTQGKLSYSVGAMLRESLRFRRNAWQLPRTHFRTRPPSEPFVFFGLHFQPESSIDVCAHFYADQLRVVELMSRSVPPTHRLLIKPHKSASAHYSATQLAQFTRFPGVELVSPHASSREFIERAALVFSIQGTIGLEAALYGKPVIMFADSPTRVFASVATAGELADLPALVRRKLAQPVATRAEVLEGLMNFMEPFCPASMNDWTRLPSDAEIDGYVELFDLLAKHLQRADRPAPLMRAAGSTLNATSGR